MDANARSSNRGDIAIIGMSCVFPGAEDYEQFWRNICGKLDQIGQPPPEWGAERYLNGVGPSRISTAAGGYLGDLYRFDPASLGVMPTAVDGAEPDQFLALKAARDALADAGYLREDYDHGNTGIVLGKGAYLHRGTGSMLQHGLLLDQLLSLLRELFPDATEDGLARLRQALLAKLPPFNADVAAGLVPASPPTLVLARTRLWQLPTTTSVPGATGAVPVIVPANPPGTGASAAPPKPVA